ncbi:MAG: hypothetical protein METHAR1v1_10004 [Methanothrix sp.]|jgi:ATP-dependent DNA helicase RecG|nr:MAG: hypothetical protein METHAR1v1_10004 [Methanothrix sp.]
MAISGSFQVERISLEDAKKILEKQESHFLEFKSKKIDGKRLQKTVTSFANADGGEVLIGIENPDDSIQIIDRWIGFINQEDANPLIQTVIQDITPSPPVKFEFYKVDKMDYKGMVLHIIVSKSTDIHYTSKGMVYERKGAQKLPISGDAVINLKLSKGLVSYENQTVSDYSVEELSHAEELQSFLEAYSPRTKPFEFLKKQRLIKKDDGGMYSLILAGVLLYADNPSTILSKKCAVKITRYDTNELEPSRIHLKEQYTIEGPLKKQIDRSLEKIREIIESVPILNDGVLEKAKYPTEAIKELIVNAVIHRDYNIPDDVHVFIYNNRIEVGSPGRLPGHITIDNILDERFARNSKIVRLLNKYPDTPNKDIGEGLNTVFQKMNEMKLKSPKIEVKDNAVIVTLPHEPLASSEETVLEYLRIHDEISNQIARKITGIKSENDMKNVFYRLRENEMIEQTPGKKGSASTWRLKQPEKSITQTVLAQYGYRDDCTTD